MTFEALTPYQRAKLDESDDSDFYFNPKLVHHLDHSFRARLTKFYRETISADSVILDLMSSWVSHLPTDISYKRVIGHGLNNQELRLNRRLDSYWIQNLNENQILPLADSSVDCCLMVAAWQYLQYPEAIASEIRRIVNPTGKLIVSFSNRAFWTKTPQVWRDGSDLDRVNYISNVLASSGWSQINYISEDKASNGLLGLLGKKNDPFFCVIATCI